MVQADILPPDDGSRAAPPPARRLGCLIAAVVAVLAVALVGLGAIQIGRELTRPPTPVELDRAAALELAGRWRSWPAGKIFPGTLPYTLDVGGKETARRVGISPDTRCETAVQVRLAGCRAIIRATYLDQLQGLAITVGVAAFADEAAARKAAAQVPGKRPTLRALAFPGSVAARFSDQARQTGTVKQLGPYVVLTSMGYADGRPAARARQRQGELFAIAPQLADVVLKPLAAPARPACSAQGWTC